MAASMKNNCHSSSVHFKEQIDDILNEVKSRIDKSNDEEKSSYEDCDRRCRTLLSKIMNTEMSFHDQTTKYLQEFAPIVLDLTFIDENKLVTKEFPDDISHSVIQYIFKQLDALISLATLLFPDQKSIESLGEELVECIYWRKGALLYMYCKTIENDETRITNNLQIYKKYLLSGVEYLKEMMQTRRPADINRSDVETTDEQTFDLLRSGIYSDTHVLGLVYGGEMCFWIDRCVKQDHFQTSDNNYKQIGQDFLSLYIKVVSGPLISQGWSVEVAESMLKSLTS